MGGVGPDSQEDVELTEDSDIEEENKQRKLPGLTRKDVDESLISGTRYVARLRAQHAKMNPDTDWARLDSQSRNDGLSDEENGTVLARGYKNDKAFDDILRTNEDLVVKSPAKLLPDLL
jgi:U3 small nucleolar RNA-associated protein 18